MLGKKNIRAFLIRLKREGSTFLDEFRRLAYKPLEIPVNLSTITKMLEDFIHLDLRSKLHLINKDVYVIHGVGDSIVPLRCGKFLHQQIRGSKFIPLAGGHLPIGYERVIFEILKS